MNAFSIDELKDIVSAFYTDTFSKLADGRSIKSYEELMSLWTDFQNMHIESAENAFQKLAGNFLADTKAPVIEKIEAQSVIIEVVDQVTGKLFRRNLPVKFTETDNGVFLSGETINGTPSDIAFLSDTALKRINDLTGKGPDIHVCHD